jgi:aminoglycoside phosphotransferase (APT) family kinase protein
MLAGAPAVEAELDDRQRVTLAPSLASFLACLHGLDAQSVGLQGDPWRRLDVPYRQLQCQSVLQELLGAGTISQSLHDALEAAIALAPWTSDPEVVISHGDLYCRHLLVDWQAALSGVIDWGDLHLNSRAIDLQVVWSFLPPSGRDEFRANYPEVSEHVWALARFRAICHSALVARYARSIRDHKLLAESLRALDWAAKG